MRMKESCFLSGEMDETAGRGDGSKIILLQKAGYIEYSENKENII